MNEGLFKVNLTEIEFNFCLNEENFKKIIIT